jgi:hypothetical protein
MGPDPKELIWFAKKSLRAIPGPDARTVHGLACGGDEKRRIGGEFGGVEGRTAGGEQVAGAPADRRAECQSAGGRCKRAQHGAAAGERRLVNMM